MFRSVSLFFFFFFHSPAITILSHSDLPFHLSISWSIYLFPRCHSLSCQSTLDRSSLNWYSVSEKETYDDSMANAVTIMKANQQQQHQRQSHFFFGMLVMSSNRFLLLLLLLLLLASIAYHFFVCVCAIDTTIHNVHDIKAKMFDN